MINIKAHRKSYEAVFLKDISCMLGITAGRLKMAFFHTTLLTRNTSECIKKKETQQESYEL